MHLRNFPHYYVKDGERRAVYYSAEARDLRSLGWTKEEQIKVKPQPEPQPEPEQVEVVAEDPNFDFMTKVELLEYAAGRGVDLPNNALKAELIEACKAL